MNTNNNYFSSVVDPSWAEPLVNSMFGPCLVPERAASAAKPIEPDEDGLPDKVRLFRNSYFDGHLVYANETFYTYKDGYWPALDLRAEVRRPIAELLDKQATPKRVNDYVNLLQDLCAEKSFDEKGESRLICLANGALEPETGKLLPHSAGHRLRTKLDIAWDPGASCPRWIRFLEEVFENDVDKEAKIRCLREWFGYCLIPDSSMHKFVWLIGSGGNGKSVVLDVLKSLLGEENVSHAHIGALEDPTTRAELENKLVNISAELGAGAFLGEHFKQFVSGDPVMAKRLYQNPFSFRPFVRLMCSTNELPRLSDQSRAFERRAVILRFNREFGVDNTLLPQLLKERAGILAWAVKGLQDLRLQGAFTIPPSSLAELAQYKKDSDNVQLFLEDEVEILTEGRGIEPKSLYEYYAAWCVECGYAKLNKNNFGKRLAKAGVIKKPSNGQDYWLVKLKDPLSPPFSSTSVFPYAAGLRALRP